MANFNSKKISVKNTLQDIQFAIYAFEEFAEETNMPMATMMKINIVLDELLSNIVKYGFPEEKESEIDITLELFSTGKLIITLSDQGVPFNPFEAPKVPDLSLPMEDWEIGGLGIHLVKELMDEYHYQRVLDLNVVSMVKLK